MNRASTRGGIAWGFSIVAAIALTIVGGVIQGQRINRWGEPANVKRAVENLRNIPTEFGDWQLLSIEKFDESTLAILRCYESTNCIYVNGKTGKRISAIVLLGPPGPLVAHTPEICYGGRDYAIETPPHAVEVKQGSTNLGEFTALTLRSRGLLAQLVKVFYGWNDGRGWRTPSDPRLAFGAEPLLYKVQIAETSLPTGEADEETCELFLKDFLPVLDSTIFHRP